MITIQGMRGEWHLVEGTHAVLDVIAIGEDSLKSVKESLSDDVAFQSTHSLVLLSGEYLVAVSVGKEGDMRELMDRAIREIIAGHPVDPGELMTDMAKGTHDIAVDDVCNQKTEDIVH